MFDTVSISGTPGTGKTDVSKALVEKTGYKILDVNEVVKNSEEIEFVKDEERNTLSVDIGSMRKVLEEKVVDKTVLEGHLSHHHGSDLIIVLRCSPEKLEERLKSRDWSEKKIRENVESEVIDVILQEAVNMHGDKVIEIDTTGKNSDEVAKEIQEILEGKRELEDYRPGTVEWSEEYLYG